MAMLVAAAAVFLAIHLLISGTRVRDGAVAVVGENAYLGLFSLASLGVILWLAMSYNAAQATGSTVLYSASIALRHLAIPIVLLAFLIGVPGLLTANPTTVGLEGMATKTDTVRGVLRVTRHPFLWGVAIWSALHLGLNGDEASIVLFGTLFAVAVLGTFSIDAKRRRKLGSDWSGFAAKTSNIPFAAILAGRNSFNAREFLDWRFLVAIALFSVFLLIHFALFHHSPFPNGWAPFTFDQLFRK